jgi:hypothetical protein
LGASAAMFLPRLFLPESCLPPLALSWLRASTLLWSQLVLARGGLLRAAFVADLQLARATPPSAKSQPWSDSVLRMLEWLARQGGAERAGSARLFTRPYHAVRSGLHAPRAPIAPPGCQAM